MSAILKKGSGVRNPVVTLLSVDSPFHNDNCPIHTLHYHDVTMSALASQITSIAIVYSTVYSEQILHQSSASLAFVRGIHRWPVNSPQKGPVTRKMFPFHELELELELEKMFIRQKTNTSRNQCDKWYIQSVLCRETLTKALSAPLA